MTPGAAAAAAAAAATAGGGEKVATYWNVMYTKHSNKKHKTYDDGVLALDGTFATVYDAGGKQVVRVHMKATAARAGLEMDVGSYELEVMSELPAADYASGRVFIGANTVAPAATTGGGGGGAPRAPFRPVGRGGGAAAAAAADDGDEGDGGDGGGEVVARRRRPAGGGGGGGASAPRHNPFASQALVLQWPGPGGGTPLTEAPAAWSGGVPVVVDPVVGNALRPHQREGVAFAWRCLVAGGGEGGCILADDMGLGKTLQTIGVVWSMLKQSVGGGPLVTKAVVVCPSSLVGNWRAEFKKWLGDERCRPLAMDRQGAEAADAIRNFVAGSPTLFPPLIISYQMGGQHLAPLTPRDAPRRTRAPVGGQAPPPPPLSRNKTIAALAAIPTRRRLLLTGTPVQNNLEELYAMASFCVPGVLGSPAVFRRVFQTPIEAGRDRTASAPQRALAAERSSELARQLAQFVLRRTARVLEAFLPPKVELTVFCRLAEPQIDMYRRLLRCRHMYPGGEAVLILLNELRKVCVHPALVTRTPPALNAPLLDISAAGRAAWPSGGGGAPRPPRGRAPPPKRGRRASTSSDSDVGGDDGGGGDDDDDDDDDGDGVELVSSDSDGEGESGGGDDVDGSGDGDDGGESDAGAAAGAEAPPPPPTARAPKQLARTLQVAAPTTTTIGGSGGGGGDAAPDVCAAALATLTDAAALAAFVASSSKLSLLVSLLHTIRTTTTDRVVLVSNFTQVLDVFVAVCRHHGYDFLRLDGGTLPEKRLQLVNSFNRPDSTTFAFLLSSRAGGVGLNLVGANRLILFDASWNPAIDKQALARVWRDGQMRITYIYRLFAAHTLEEKVFQRQLLKADFASAAGQGDEGGGGGGGGGEGGGAGASTSCKFSRAELRELFAMNPADAAACDTERVMTLASGGSAGGEARGGRDRDRGRGGAAAAPPPPSRGRMVIDDDDEEDEGGGGGAAAAAAPAATGATPVASGSWVPYTGPASIADAALRTAAASPAAHVSYVFTTLVNMPADAAAH